MAAGPNTPFIVPSADQFKVLKGLCEMNPDLFWSDDKEANMFIAGLESILEFSPLLHTHWTALLFNMVPGTCELERTWIRTNIMTPALSWNAAKAAFIGHFQRGDYMDGQRYLYNDCHQTQHESIQQYSRRFHTLATQLGYADNDLQSIYRYIGGLQQNTQQKLYSLKLQHRTVGANPTWDFTSLTTTIQLAVTIGIESIHSGLVLSSTSAPTHLRSSALANPVYQTTVTSHSAVSRKRKVETAQAKTEMNSGMTTCYRCQQQGHYAYQCPTTRSRRTKTIDVSQLKCYSCQNPGHRASECPVQN
jgi:hypothetical protein